VAVAGHYAYLAGGANGLHVLDVANPVHPTKVGDGFVLGSADRVVVAGNYAYVTENNLRVFNVADPAHPFEAGFYYTPGPATNLAVNGNYIYVATQRGGLVVLWYTPPVTTSIPGAGGNLTSPVDNTVYTFPSGAFTSTVTITHTPRFPGNAPSFGNLVGIGHVFEVTATYSTGRPAQLAPGQTYTLTVSYADAEKGPAIEDTLAFYYWNGSQWVLESSSAVNTSTNTMTARPNHFSLWAVLGETRRVFLPLVLRN
jgi:hypothetical protein